MWCSTHFQSKMNFLCLIFEYFLQTSFQKWHFANLLNNEISFSLKTISSRLLYEFLNSPLRLILNLLYRNHEYGWTRWIILLLTSYGIWVIPCQKIIKLKIFSSKKYIVQVLSIRKQKEVIKILWPRVGEDGSEMKNFEFLELQKFHQRILIIKN